MGRGPGQLSMTMYLLLRKWFVFSTIVSLVIFPRLSQASLFRFLELEELTETSDLIVLGKVGDVESHWNERRTGIRTRVMLKVKEVFRGSHDRETLVFELPGGVVEEDGLGQAVPGVPKFAAGEEAVLFMRFDPHLLCPVSGWSQGKFDVATDPATGKNVVLDRFGICARYRSRRQGRREATIGTSENKVSIEEFTAIIAEIQENEAAGKTIELTNTSVSASLVRENSVLPASAFTLGYAYSGFKWQDQDIPVDFYVYTGRTPPAGIQLRTYVDAVKAAFQKWEDVPSSYMAFYYRGETGAYPPDLQNTDGRNVVGWVSGQIIGNALAQTVYWYSVPANHLLEWDIALNVDWSWSAATPIPLSTFDLHTTILHEAGHTLSLDDLYHGSDSDEVMFYAVSSGQMKRQLSDGDIAGVTFIYPNTADLTVLSVDGPPSALEHEAISLSATIRNAGGKATTKCRLEFYLSLTPGGSDKDVSLGGTGIPILFAGQEYNANLSGEVPLVEAEGDYYVRAIADAQMQVQEANEDNNTDFYFPLNVRFDKDGDGLPNWWEIEVSLNPNDSSGDNGADGDPDGEGLVNLEEYQFGSNPRLADTDADGQNDRDEVAAGTDPTDAASVFRILYVEVNADGTDRWLTILWTTVSGKRYQLYCQDQLETPWIPLGPIQGGNGSLIGFNDLGGLNFPTRFYRVAVE